MVCPNCRLPKDARRGTTSSQATSFAYQCYTASDCEFFFTICARRNGEPFTNPELAKAIIEALLWRKRHHNWTMYCYTLMPDHLHFVVQLPAHQIHYFDAGGRGIVPKGILTRSALSRGSRRHRFGGNKVERVAYGSAVVTTTSFVTTNP